MRRFRKSVLLVAALLALQACERHSRFYPVTVSVVGGRLTFASAERGTTCFHRFVLSAAGGPIATAALNDASGPIVNARVLWVLDPDQPGAFRECTANLPLTYASVPPGMQVEVPPKKLPPGVLYSYTAYGDESAGGLLGEGCFRIRSDRRVENVDVDRCRRAWSDSIPIGAGPAPDPARWLVVDPPRPLQSPQSYISDADYPVELAQKRAAGTVGYRLELNELGLPQTCTVTRSSGFAALDEATCRSMNRAIFKPARNLHGNAIPAPVEQEVTWHVPARL